MSAPFFDSSGQLTIYPGDYAILRTKHNGNKKVFVRRVFMEPHDNNVFIPSAEVQYHGVIGSVPTEKLTKCIHWLDSYYVSVASLQYEHMPLPGQYVLVWSIKRKTYLAAKVVSIEDDITVIEYNPGTYQVPTALVHVKIEGRRK